MRMMDDRPRRRQRQQKNVDPDVDFDCSMAIAKLKQQKKELKAKLNYHPQTPILLHASVRQCPLCSYFTVYCAHIARHFQAKHKKEFHQIWTGAAVYPGLRRKETNLSSEEIAQVFRHQNQSPSVNSNPRSPQSYQNRNQHQRHQNHYSDDDDDEDQDQKSWKTPRSRKVQSAAPVLIKSTVNKCPMCSYFSLCTGHVARHFQAIHRPEFEKILRGKEEYMGLSIKESAERRGEMLLKTDYSDQSKSQSKSSFQRTPVRVQLLVRATEIKCPLCPYISLSHVAAHFQQVHTHEYELVVSGKMNYRGIVRTKKEVKRVQPLERNSRRKSQSLNQDQDGANHNHLNSSLPDSCSSPLPASEDFKISPESHSVPTSEQLPQTTPIKKSMIEANVKVEPTCTPNPAHFRSKNIKRFSYRSARARNITSTSFTSASSISSSASSLSRQSSSSPSPDNENTEYFSAGKYIMNSEPGSFPKPTTVLMSKSMKKKNSKTKRSTTSNTLGVLRCPLSSCNFSTNTPYGMMIHKNCHEIPDCLPPFVKAVIQATQRALIVN